MDVSRHPFLPECRILTAASRDGKIGKYREVDGFRPYAQLSRRPLIGGNENRNIQWNAEQPCHQNEAVIIDGIPQNANVRISCDDASHFWQRTQSVEEGNRWQPT